MTIFDLRNIIAYDDEVIIEDNDNDDRTIYCDPWGRIPIYLLDLEVLRIYTTNHDVIHLVVCRG